MKRDGTGRGSGAKQGMSTKPLKWPYNAKEARDRSAEEAAAIVETLEPLFTESNDPNVLRKAGIAIHKANLILRHMEAQGAATRPR